MRTAVFHETFASEESLWDSPTSRSWMAAFALALFSLPLWGSDYALAMACIVGIHVIATLGLNLTTGNAGLISLSHGAFLGVGCYTVAWLGKQGVPFYVTLPVAGLLTAALGLVVGLPSLRVKGIYLAVATLAAHFILTFVFREWEPVTGGVPGTTIPRARLFGFEFIGDRRNFYLIFVCAFIAALGARNLARTYIGRAFVAVRERDFSAELLGVNLLAHQVAGLCDRRVLCGRRRWPAGLLLRCDYARVLRAHAVGVLPRRRHRRWPRHRARQRAGCPVHDLHCPRCCASWRMPVRNGFPAWPGCCCRWGRSCSACSSSAFSCSSRMAWRLSGRASGACFISGRSRPDPHHDSS